MVTWFMVQPLIRLLLLHWHILFVNDSTPAFLCHELQPKCIQNARRPKADTDIQRLPMGYKQSPPDPRNNLFPRYRPGIPMSQETGGPHLPPLAACSISFSKFLGVITDFQLYVLIVFPKWLTASIYKEDFCDILGSKKHRAAVSSGKHLPKRRRQIPKYQV